MEKREECGIVGVYSKTGKDVAPLLYRALIALQHRGQDAAGFAVFDGKKIIGRHGLGLVEDVFAENDLKIKGRIGIGHTRYPTIGNCRIEDVQPSVYKETAVAHNGHLANYDVVRKRLEGMGYRFKATVDSEPLAYYIDKFGIEEGVRRIMNECEGAYSDVAIHKGRLYVFRDPFGIRPLVWGENRDFVMFASESVALDINDIEYRGDFENGILFDAIEGKKMGILKKERRNCMFEYVYFSRPDSIINDKSVRNVRVALGEQLALEAPVKCDVVVPIPDTSRTAAASYAAKLGVPYDEGLIKNRYIGRTFIMPTQEKRKEAVRLKLNPLKDVMEGKKVVLIDDSIVRATTMREIVSIVRNRGGAREVHVRITSPPIIAPCFYGVDIPTYSELIASSKSVEEIRRFIGADSLAYLSIDGLKKAIGLPICEGCIAGRYQTSFVSKMAGAAKGR